MFYGITDLSTFILGTIFIILLPGPNSLYVMTIASKAGIGAGYQAAAGVFIGDIVLMVLSATGAASVLAASPTLFIGLKYLGASYLAWIGFGLIRSALQHWSMGSARATIISGTFATPTSSTKPVTFDSSASVDPSGLSGSTKTLTPQHPSTAKARLTRFRFSAITPFRTALGISLINPKSILFFVSFFIQFVDPDYAHPVLSFFILGVILQILSMIYLTVLILGGAHLAQAFSQKKRLSSLMTGLVGLIFIGFGLRLATASLT